MNYFNHTSKKVTFFNKKGLIFFFYSLRKHNYVVDNYKKHLEVPTINTSINVASDQRVYNLPFTQQV